MTDVARGRLLPPTGAPSVGERTEEIVRLGAVVVEQILSGALPAPIAYKQDHDEWVLVQAGAAVLEVEGERLQLGAGDWVLLRADVQHRLVETLPGTSWLALRILR